tara:strand:+ start:354 stop:704 length:351 start_codon:yes stop_codon:yes gene_type:complete
MSNYYRAQAVYATHPTAKHGDGTNYYDENGIVISLDETKITEKQKEIESLEFMRLLREERNRKLAETDWMSFSDSPTMTDAWRTYRQALRDLPSTAKPQLDENGQLTNVTWPTKPE